MKLMGSILVGSLHGSSGDVTAFTWKGRQALRRRVVPYNPQTDAQDLQRTAFSRCVECFQGIVQAVKDFLDILGTSQQMSGYNILMKDSVKSERDNHRHRVMPPNRYVNSVASLAAAEGGAAGSITLTWDTGTWAATDLPVVLTRKKNTSGDEYGTPWVSFPPGAATMATGTLTITGLTPGASYAVALFPSSPAPDTLPALTKVYGGGDSKIQTAKAA